MPERLVLHALPELAQGIEAACRRIARNKRRIDGANRSTDDPVGLEAGFVQRLIDACLKGAECPSPLEDENHLLQIRGKSVGLGLCQFLHWLPRRNRLDDALLLCCPAT